MIMTFDKIKSIALFTRISILRTFDHAYRYYTGLPYLAHSAITSNIYLGGQYYSQGLKNINKIGITAIVSMRERPIRQLSGFEKIKTLHLQTKDFHAPSIENLQKGIRFMTDEIQTGGKVYVHCHLGEGRGPTMVIAYLMSTGMLFEDAHTLVKNVRPFIRLTKHQVERLKELEILLKPDLIK